MGAVTPRGTARTVTMLFTDIEGSTVLLRRLGSRWGEALTAQRAIVRAAVRESHGEEMGTEGDSFFVVFTSAHDAVRAAVTAQRALQAHEWPEGAPLRVRMGLHTGEPERHGEGYIGEDVHLAARIGATSHGGQVVLSETTRQLVPDLAGDLAGVAFRDLGRHRLKDIHGDTHLYDVRRSRSRVAVPAAAQPRPAVGAARPADRPGRPRRRGRRGRRDCCPEGPGC